jgi:hypothetical protein
LADITAISDRGLDKLNPYRTLTKALYERVRRLGLQPNHFSVHVGGRHSGPVYKGGPRVLLKIPGSARFPEIIFGKAFRDFIGRIMEEPGKGQICFINTVDSDVRILYAPRQRFAMGRHPAYKEIYSRTENAIYQALQRKASQLVQTGYQGPLGIFLCDGGCTAFKKRWGHGLSYPLDEIVQSFLHENARIGFVVALTTGIGEDCNGWGPRGSYQTCIRLYVSPKLDESALDLSGTLTRLLKVLPTPESDPVNALHLLESEHWNRGRSKGGGMEWSDTKIKISSRALAELLSGRMDQRTFFEMHGFIQSAVNLGPPINPFAVALSRGELIQSISVERMNAEDDDWLEFEMKGPDPAISPFRSPFDRP